MSFCLSQRYHVWPFRTFGVNHHNHIYLKKTEATQALLSVVLPLVFSGHGEVVRNCIASNEVKPVLLDVQLAFWFVLCDHI